MEDRREAVHALGEERLQRLRRDVASGKAGAARGDDDVDIVSCDPCLDRALDRLSLILCNSAIDEPVAGFLDAPGQSFARAIVAEAPRVRYGQNGDADREKGAIALLVGKLGVHGISHPLSMGVRSRLFALRERRINRPVAVH